MMSYIESRFSMCRQGLVSTAAYMVCLMGKVSLVMLTPARRRQVHSLYQQSEGIFSPSCQPQHLPTIACHQHLLNIMHLG